MDNVRFVPCIFVEQKCVFAVVHGVGFVVRSSADIFLNIHGSISNGVVNFRSVGAVDWYLLEIGSESMPVRIGVGEESALEDPVSGGTHPWHEIAGGEGGLFSLGEIVVNIAIEDNLSNFYQRIISLRYNFSRIEHVPFVLGDICFRNSLETQLPFCCFS